MFFARTSQPMSQLPRWMHVPCCWPCALTKDFEWRGLKEEGARSLDPHLDLRMAELYEFEGDDRWQRDWLAKAADLLPKDIRLKTKLATHELCAGRPQAAADLYDKALAMRPGTSQKARRLPIGGPVISPPPARVRHASVVARATSSNNAPPSNGFTRKATAPSRSACRRTSSSSWAVIRMTAS